MSIPRIGIIVSSVREKRFADQALDWLMPIANKRRDMEFEVLDLQQYVMPLFYDDKPREGEPAADPVAQQWRAKLDQMDGFLFLVAEYNRGPTAALKNAIDWAYAEWVGKPGACIGYGGTGASRAIEQLRSWMIELQMVPVRQAVYIGGAEMMAIWTEGKTIGDFDHYAEEANTVFDNLEWWATSLKDARKDLKTSA